jgi:predicted RNA-binding Zn ribbon-like protein
MIAFSRTRDPAALAVGLANTWDAMDDEPELLRSASALRKLLRLYGEARLAPRVVDADVPKVVELRRRLRTAFDAESPGAAAAILNAILRGKAAAPQLAQARGSWTYRYLPEAAPVADVLAVSSALALADVIRRGGWSRFGRCAAAPCDCVFVDASRNRSRRYCSRLCADRVSQAAYRRRHHRPSSRHQSA